MGRPSVDKRNHAFGQRVGRVTEDAISIAVIGFVVLGLGGMVYKALKPGGWLSAALDRIWNQSPLLVWLIGFTFAGALALGRWWLVPVPPSGSALRLPVPPFDDATAAASCTSWASSSRAVGPGPRCGNRSRCARRRT